MFIQHNLAAINTLNSMYRNNEKIKKDMEKLSSGKRINRAADDAAGLSISEKMRGQIRGLNMARKNALDGISLIQTAEGALSSVHDMLQRMNELSVQAANGTYSYDDRLNIALELSALGDEIDNVVMNTTFNSIDLLGGPVQPITLQIGDGQGDTMDLIIDKTSLPQSMLLFGPAYNMLGDVHVNLADPSNAGIVQTRVLDFIDKVSAERSKLGAAQNRLESTCRNLATSSENLSASESRIRDLDMAAGMSELVKSQILDQAVTAVLSQANQQPQNVLTLLR